MMSPTAPGHSPSSVVSTRRPGLSSSRARAVAAAGVKCYLWCVNRGGRGWIVGLAGVAAAVAVAQVAGADELELAVGQGRVTLVAARVPLGDVLAEWTRVGNTRFEGVGELGAEPVSLRLEDVAEREALRLLLRPAAGFLAAPRPPNAFGASIYDRVRIRAVRRVPQAVAAAASEGRRQPLPGPVREAPPALSAADQRERLQRLLRPRAGGEAVTDLPDEAPRDRPVFAPTTPRPGMVAEPVLPDRP